jgi:hypothetical protein
LSQDHNVNEASLSLAESSSVAKREVVRGLGYPNGRTEISPSAVGWQATTEEVNTIEKQVSRETSR